ASQRNHRSSPVEEKTRDRNESECRERTKVKERADETGNGGSRGRATGGAGDRESSSGMRSSGDVAPTGRRPGP
ncbi:unnamed protein product, partial [Boreogadus saida]